VYQFTLEAVKWFFDKGCHLVILACNTASAKALRTIQQVDLPRMDPYRRVLGVIRPTAERVARFHTKWARRCAGNRSATIQSRSLRTGDCQVASRAGRSRVKRAQCGCRLVENREHDKPGADYFVKQHRLNRPAQTRPHDRCHHPGMCNPLSPTHR